MADKIPDFQLEQEIARARAAQRKTSHEANSKGREWSALNELGAASKADGNVLRAEEYLTRLLEEQKMRRLHGGKAGLDAHRAAKAAEKARREAAEKVAKEATEKAAKEKEAEDMAYWARVRAAPVADNSAW